MSKMENDILTLNCRNNVIMLKYIKTKTEQIFEVVLNDDLKHNSTISHVYS